VEPLKDCRATPMNLGAPIFLGSSFGTEEDSPSNNFSIDSL